MIAIPQKVTFALLSVALTAVFAGATADAKSSPKPSIKVKPKTLTINRKATFEGYHLWPSSYVTFVLAVPDLVPKAAEAFVGGVERTDSHGHVKLTTKVPVMTRCGKGMIYISPFPARKATVVRTPVTLTGCTAGGKGVAPPPPPGGKKKH